MNGTRHRVLLAAAVLIPAAAGVIAWLTATAIAGDTWLVRLAVSSAVLLLAGGSAAILVGRDKSNRRALKNHIDKLCQIPPKELQAAGFNADVPPLEPASPWHPLAERVRATMIEYGRRLEELDHARTAQEIRSRRAASQLEQIRAILDGLSEPIIAIDGFEEISLANPAAQALFDLDGQPTEQRAVGQLLRCQKLVDLLTDTSHRKSTASRSDEIEIVDDQGQSQWYHVSASKLGHRAGESEGQDRAVQGAVAVLRDIGSQKELQKRNAEFVSSVSHEMKTPLAGIKAYVELLVDGDAEDEETREEFLNVINGQADRLQRLVDNMLNLARIEAGVVNVNKKHRSLNELLEEAVHVVQPAAEAKQIEMATELSPLYLGVLADRDMLLQSAINLLSNAIKYTPEGGRVTLRSRSADHQVVFEVEDTGVGLSEEDCQRVFEKFYRVKKDKTMASGTGLGLPLAKHIVEDVHGGRVFVNSELGVGSTFRIALPNPGQMA